MKLRTLLIAVLSLVATAIMAQKTAYAVYCEGSNTEEDPATLYFLASETEPTGTHNGQTITQTWPGTKVTDTGVGFPAWRSKVKTALKRVIFEASFADVKPTSCYSWFDSCDKLTTIEGIENLNTEEVTRMDYMFNDCAALETLDLSSFNTAECTGIRRMFYGCSALQKLTLGARFTAEKVIDISDLFRGCAALKSLDLRSFKTLGVDRMSDMFNGCAVLESLDLSNFNTEDVQSMSGMFNGCAALETLDLSNFKTEKVQSMREMFSGCSALKTLDLSSFNTAMCYNMSSMFNNCSALASLDLSSFKTENVAEMSLMFYGCSALETLDLSGFTTEKVYSDNMSLMFSGCSALKTLDLRKAGKAADMVATNSGFAKRGMVIYLPDDADASGDVFEENYVVKPAAGSTSFARTFTGGNTSTVCLPFAVNTAGMTDGTFYEFKACDDKTVKFVKTASDATVADKAYLFKPAAAGKVTFTGTAIDGLPETTEGEADGLYGVYAEKEFTKDEADMNIYYGWSAGNFVSIGAGATLSHGRGYLKLAQTSGAKNILKAVFDDETTGISEVNAAAEADAPAYDLTGRRVSAAYKGIVIKNGKKTMR